MNIKQVKSCNGTLTQIYLTEFEKKVFVALVKTASMPTITSMVNGMAKSNQDFSVDNQRVGKVLLSFLEGVK